MTPSRRRWRASRSDGSQVCCLGSESDCVIVRNWICFGGFTWIRGHHDTQQRVQYSRRTAMELRVAPRFPSFSAAAGEILRVAPRPRSFSLASQCFRRVAPASAPSGCASDGVPGCPASRILRRCRQLELRVTPPLRSSCLASQCFHRVAPASASSGCRRPISGLPRILLPSALPPLRPLGCPWVLQLRLGR
jgi:hypothetical protein